MALALVPAGLGLGSVVLAVGVGGVVFAFLDAVPGGALAQGPELLLEVVPAGAALLENGRLWLLLLSILLLILTLANQVLLDHVEAAAQRLLLIQMQLVWSVARSLAEFCPPLTGRPVLARAITITSLYLLSLVVTSKVSKMTKLEM